MIIGIDTYRDSQSRSSHMVGFVASINATCTRYYSRVIEQRSQQDLISGLKRSMQGNSLSLPVDRSHLMSSHLALDALQRYHEVNGALPAKIIIYRDGVNDAQLIDVIEGELPALNELCMTVQEGYE